MECQAATKETEAAAYVQRWDDLQDARSEEGQGAQCYMGMKKKQTRLCLGGASLWRLVRNWQPSLSLLIGEDNGGET